MVEVPQGAPQNRVDHEGGELPDDDGDLIASREGAADFVGGEFGEEHRDHRGGSAHGETEADAARDQQSHVGRENDDDRTQEEQHGQDDDGSSSPDGIRNSAPRRRRRRRPRKRASSSQPPP